MVSACELKELDALERDLEPMAGKPGGSNEVRISYLRLARRLRVRRPHPVARHGLAVLSSDVGRHQLGGEVWDVYEQSAIAAMDCHSLKAAKECIGALMVAFPGSARVGRLEGMWLEANGWWDQAEKVYADLLERNPQDQPVLKRQVCLIKSRGNTAGAVEALRKYLDTYMADYEAWRELGDLYISLQMFKQAGFCYEEVLLSAPANPMLHTRYAEILYSIGGADNLRSALSHFAAAIEYSGGANTRALYGTCMASTALEACNKASKGGEGHPEILVEAAKDALRQEYRVRNASLLKAVVEPALSKA